MALILPDLSEKWGLNSAQLGAIGGAVFLGMGFGAVTWGPYADRFGRRSAYVATLLVASVFGFASCLSRGFWAMLFLRLGFGFGVGGFLPVSSTLLLESIPREWSAAAYGSANILFTIGAVFEATLGWIVLPVLGWRGLVAISAAPLILALIAACWLLESPYWLHSSGRTREAEQVPRSGIGAGSVRRDSDISSFGRCSARWRV